MGIAIVTGASSGMGREFVKQICENKYADSVWAVARRAERLDELRASIGGMVRPVECDLTNRDDIKKLADMLGSERPRVDMLVNCAGFAKFGTYDQVSLDDTLNMIELDVRALVYLTQTALPYMEEKSRVVQIASTAAFQPLPGMNVYAASKAFVLSYSRALNDELQQRGISVTTVCPGWTKTEFFDVAEKNASKNTVGKTLFMSTPEHVAASALKAANGHREMCVPGITNKIHLFFSKIIPDSLIMRIWKMLK
jgi:short-subunit dehydrogenase